MIDIDYSKCNVPRRLESVIREQLGDPFADELMSATGIPEDSMNPHTCAAVSDSFMKELRKRLPDGKIREIFVEVRHDLHGEDFGWAVRLFRESKDIDDFAYRLQRGQIDDIRACYERGVPYSGIELTNEVMSYIESDPYIFYGTRIGDRIVARAIPCVPKSWLSETDPVRKRFHACHCRYVRESILKPESTVSDLFCACSLGHTKILWETVLGQSLAGRVVRSALKGDPECMFEIFLPEGTYLNRLP